MAHERRYLKQNETQLRATRGEGGGNTICGYAAKFGVESEELYDERRGVAFREVLLPGCFDLEANKDVVCNFDHDDNKILGRTTSGTLTLSADETGLYFECRAPNTTLGNDLVELIGRGDINANSFAFDIPDGGEEWGETADGTPLRKITRCILYDVSCVIHPAYPETELALRHFKPKPRPTDHNRAARLRLAEAEDL